MAAVNDDMDMLDACTASLDAWGRGVDAPPSMTTAAGGGDGGPPAAAAAAGKMGGFGGKAGGGKGATKKAKAKAGARKQVGRVVARSDERPRETRAHGARAGGWVHGERLRAARATERI